MSRGACLMPDFLLVLSISRWCLHHHSSDALFVFSRQKLMASCALIQGPSMVPIVLGCYFNNEVENVRLPVTSGSPQTLCLTFCVQQSGGRTSKSLDSVDLSRKVAVVSSPPVQATLWMECNLTLCPSPFRVKAKSPHSLWRMSVPKKNLSALLH